MVQKLANKELLKKRRKLFINIFIISILFIFYVVAVGHSLYRKDLKNEQSRMSLLESQLKEQTATLPKMVIFGKVLNQFKFILPPIVSDTTNITLLNNLHRCFFPLCIFLNTYLLPFLSL